MRTIMLTIVFWLLIQASYSQSIASDSLYLGKIPPAETSSKSQLGLRPKYIRPKVVVINNTKASIASTFTSNMVDNTTAVKHSGLQNIQVYPNPTSGNINISFGSTADINAAVEIANSLGEAIFSNTYQNILVATIDLSQKPKGIYLLSVVIDTERIIKKIIVE